MDCPGNPLVRDGPPGQGCPVAVQAPLMTFRTCQGPRDYQEDTWAVQPFIDGHGMHFAAVFDGHGGDGVSKHAAQVMPSIIRKQLHFECSKAACPLQPSSQTTQQPSFSQTTPSSTAQVDMQQLLLNAFQQCDDSIPDEIAAQAGSTAVCALVNEQHIWVASCGDSRAVLVRQAGGAVPLTEDHKPERPDELKRVIAAGGYVFWNGGYRVMGALSMSRAMGNKYLKRFGVIPTPEIRHEPRTDDDDFLILASDGLWAVLTNEDAVRLAQASVARASSRGYDRLAALRIATRVLVKAAMQQGSTDNITVVLVDLQRPPAPTAHLQHHVAAQAGAGCDVECAARVSSGVGNTPPGSPSTGVDAVVLAEVATPARSLPSITSHTTCPAPGADTQPHSKPGPAAPTATATTLYSVSTSGYYAPRALPSCFGPNTAPSTITSPYTAAPTSLPASIPTACCLLPSHNPPNTVTTGGSVPLGAPHNGSAPASPPAGKRALCDPATGARGDGSTAGDGGSLVKRSRSSGAEECGALAELRPRRASSPGPTVAAALTPTARDLGSVGGRLASVGSSGVVLPPASCITQQQVLEQPQRGSPAERLLVAVEM